MSKEQPAVFSRRVALSYESENFAEVIHMIAALAAALLESTSSYFVSSALTSPPVRLASEILIETQSVSFRYWREASLIDSWFDDSVMFSITKSYSLKVEGLSAINSCTAASSGKF